MKPIRHLLPLACTALWVAACSTPAEKQRKATPPPVFKATAEAAPTGEYEYAQQPVSGRAPLVSEEQARAIIERFKAAYPKLGSPRLAFYVNRQLIDQSSGLKIVSRTVQTKTQSVAETEGEASASQEKEKVATQDRYDRTDPEPRSLADRQTVRDIERLLGRPFRFAGARIADHELAAQLQESPTILALTLDNAEAVKDRKAIAAIADVVVEVLIDSKEVRVSEPAGDRIYTVPDLHLTALRLEDARIVGQAASSDIYGGSPSPVMARHYTVQEITEATALALMEDMISTQPE